MPKSFERIEIQYKRDTLRRLCHVKMLSSGTRVNVGLVTVERSADSSTPAKHNTFSMPVDECDGVIYRKGVV